MQPYKFDEMINRACEKKNLNKETMKSMSDFIWRETKQEMSNFSNLRIYLCGLVAWYYGLTRLKDFRVKIDNKLNESNKPVTNKQKVGFLEGLDEQELLSVSIKVDDLLKLYEVYIEDKNTTKDKYRADMKILLEQKRNKS